MTTAESRQPVHLADGAALDAFVADHPLALVECYTEGCAICASMEPVLGVLARQTDAAVAMITPRDDPPLVERFDVRSVPLFVRFVDGEPAGRRAEGFVGADDLAAWLRETASAKSRPRDGAGMAPELGIGRSHVVLALGLTVFAVPNALARPSLVGTVGTLLAAFLASFLFVWGLSRMIALLRPDD